MLTRVQREFRQSQPFSLYSGKKRNSVVVLNKETGVPQIVIQKNVNGYDLESVQPLNNTSAHTTRKILAMLQEVNNKRTIRECRQSDEELGSVLGMHAFFDHKTKNYKQKYKVYNFLNYPNGFWAISYHILVFIMVFACLIVTVFSTIDEYRIGAMHFLYLLEKVIIIWFSSEFIIRMWASSCKHEYQGWKGKIKYLSVPSRLLDVIVITLSIVVLTINPSSGHEVFAASAFRGFHRFFQVMQILTLKKQLQPWKVLSSVIYDQREQLFIIFYIEFIVLCILAYISYIVEKDDNEQFDSIAEAMWWALVTLSTIGYGDRVPVCVNEITSHLISLSIERQFRLNYVLQLSGNTLGVNRWELAVIKFISTIYIYANITWLGKLISSLFTVLGVAIFALPAGIIGTGLALKVEEEERNQQRKKKKVAAAVLIQCMWRCYKANANYMAVSSFFKHKPMDLFKKHDYENIANKFVTLTKFFIAKSRFKELLRPLDVKTLLQNYKDGQLDVMIKMKQIQNSVDGMVRKVGVIGRKNTGSENSIDNRIDRLEWSLAHMRDQIDNQLEIIEVISHRLMESQTLVDMVINHSNDDNRQKFLLFDRNNGRKRRKSL